MKINFDEYNNIFIGIVVGIVIAVLFVWFADINSKPYDWCYQLPDKKVYSCLNLHDEMLRYQKRLDEIHGNQSPDCTPDYMGGCN